MFTVPTVITVPIVRWPGKSSGAFAFALNSLLLFLSKRKRRINLHQGKKKVQKQDQLLQ